MIQQIDECLGNFLATWTTLVRRWARSILVLDAVMTLALAIFAAGHLGVNMDNKRLIAADLPFQKAAAAFARYFPSLDDTLLVVIDADTADGARSAAEALADRLSATPDIFRDVYVPGGGTFFQRRGLLYRTVAELDDFTDHLAHLQPVLADLSHDASIANLAHLIRLALDDEQAQGVSEDQWAMVLDRIAEATVRVFDEYPLSISWEDLMLEGSALDQGNRVVVVAEPVLEFGKLLAGERAIGHIRQSAQELQLLPERGVRVRVTGNPALNYDEMLGLAWDVGVAGILSFVLVTIILFVAFRSLRLVAAAAATLLAGLVWTAAFAAGSVGQLNVISIAFGVLFIGLGVDFAIHLGMQYVDAVHGGASPADAIEVGVRRIGTSLVICAVTTAIGFFAFVPTDYLGVAELGLISGTGMFVILFQTLTLFPAAITVLFGEDAGSLTRGTFRLRLAPPAMIACHPGAVAIAAVMLAVGASVLLPRLRFDVDVIAMRNPRTESVQTFKDLLARSGTSPWYVDAVAPNLERAASLSKRLRMLEEVDTAISLRDYVPADQEEKLDILADAAMLLDTPPAANDSGDPFPVKEQIAALRSLHGALRQPWLLSSDSRLARSARLLRRELGRFLKRVAEGTDAKSALADLERILLGNFHSQLRRLQLALEPPPITVAELPRDLTRRMLAPNGQARVQVFPSTGLSGTEEMTRFVDAVRTVEPDATGVAVNLVEFGRATTASLRQALAWAFVAIVILLIAFRSGVADILLMLAPVVFALAYTGASMVLLGIPFNFANVVVLPLLLGIGVDSGIHLVHRSHFAGPGNGGVLDTTTARAVFFSTVTTVASFGSLVFSHHWGIASLGAMLVFGMLITLACNLVILPALITLRGVWQANRDR